MLNRSNSCITISPYTPAATSSRTIPVPSGSFSRFLTGTGFHISKTRKSISPASRAFQCRGAPTNVMSWPATSSITTCCGSFLPDARATRVAAGIPTPIANTASNMMTGNRNGGGTRYPPIKDHRTTVVVDPQVPGPGFIVPTPKNVPTSHAQIGPRVEVEVATSVWLVSMICFRPAPPARRRRPLRVIGLAARLRIVHRSRNHITAARPLAEVDCSAPLTAERKLRLIS